MGLKPVKGKTIDLGSKSGSSGYYGFLNIDKDDVTFSDFYSEGENIVKLNLEKEFPEIGTFDNALCFNTIEHIFNTKNLLEQSNKILNKDGRFIGCVPFLYPYHADPDDFHRYTFSALKKLFEENKFKEIKIMEVGHGPLTLGFQIFPYPNILRAFAQSAIFILDLMTRFYWKKYSSNFTLIYIFEAVKA